MVYLFPQVWLLITSLTNVTTAEQLSFAVADVGSAAGTADAHCTDTGEGQVTVGFCVSFTVTLNVQVAAVPQPLVAVAVTVVVPTGKKLPEVFE